MAKGIGGGQPCGKNPKSKLTSALSKIKAAGSKKGGKSAGQGCGSMLSGIANAAKGRNT